MFWYYIRRVARVGNHVVVRALGSTCSRIMFYAVSPGRAVVGHHPLDGDRGGHRGRAEEVVAATLAVRVVVVARRAPGLHRVADVGERVVLGEDAQDGAARSPRCDEGGGHSGDAAFHCEAFVLEDKAIPGTWAAAEPSNPGTTIAVQVMCASVQASNTHARHREDNCTL